MLLTTVHECSYGNLELRRWPLWMQEQLQKGKREDTQKINGNAQLRVIWNAMLPLQMDQPTPAYCHGDKDIARDVWFGHRHQLPVQVDCFSCHPEEHSQEEVVHECRDHSTEHRNSSWDSADDEGDVQPHQSKAEVDQELWMHSFSQIPEWYMYTHTYMWTLLKVATTV